MLWLVLGARLNSEPVLDASEHTFQKGLGTRNGGLGGLGCRLCVLLLRPGLLGGRGLLRGGLGFGRCRNWWLKSIARARVSALLIRAFGQCGRRSVRTICAVLVDECSQILVVAPIRNAVAVIVLQAIGDPIAIRVLSYIGDSIAVRVLKYIRNPIAIRVFFYIRDSIAVRVLKYIGNPIAIRILLVVWNTISIWIYCTIES